MNGNWAVNVVPTPAGLVTDKWPSRASTRSREAAQARAVRGVGAADAVVGDRDDGRCRRAATRAGPPASPARTWRRWPAPRRRRSRPRARRSGSAARASRRPVAGPRAQGERLQRGVEAVLEDRGVDAAGQLAQLLERMGELGARGRDDLLGRRRSPRTATAAGAAAARSRPAAAARRRAGCAPAAAARRHPPRPGARATPAARPAAPRTPRAAAGSRARSRSPRAPPRPAPDRRRASVVDDRGDVVPVALDPRDRAVAAGLGQRDGLAGDVDVAVAPAAAARSRAAGSPSVRASAACSSPLRLDSSREGAPRARRGRAASAAARTGTRRARATSEPIATHSSAGEREPVTRSLTSTSANSSRRDRAGEARQQRAPARRRRGAEAHGDDHGSRQARQERERALELVEHVGDVRRSRRRRARCRRPRRTAARRTGRSAAGARTRRPAAARPSVRSGRRSRA